MAVYWWSVFFVNLHVLLSYFFIFRIKPKYLFNLLWLYLKLIDEYFILIFRWLMFFNMLGKVLIGISSHAYMEIILTTRMNNEICYL